MKATVKEVLDTVRINKPKEVRLMRRTPIFFSSFFFGKVGLSIGLWFISEGGKEIGLDMVLPGDLVLVI